MKLLMLVSLSLILLSENVVRAQSTASYGILVYSFNAASPANETAGTSFSIPQGSVGLVSWCSSFSSAPSAVSISLQISNDNSVYSSVQTTTATAGECQTNYLASKFVRAYLTSKTGGGTTTVSLNVLRAWGNSVGPFGIANNKAQFEIQQTTASASTPLVRISGTDDTPYGLVIANNTYSTGNNRGVTIYTGNNGAGYIWFGNPDSQLGFHINSTFGFNLNATSASPVLSLGTSTVSLGVDATGPYLQGLVTNKPLRLGNYADGDVLRITETNAHVGVKSVLEIGHSAPKALFTANAPTVSSGFGTSPTIAGITTAFTINIGTGGSASSGVLTMGAFAAANGWICDVKNLTALAANRANQWTVQTATTTTTVTVQNQTISTGAALVWTASDILQMACIGY